MQILHYSFFQYRAIHDCCSVLFPILLFFRQSVGDLSFRNGLINFIIPLENKIFNMHDQFSVTYVNTNLDVAWKKPVLAVLSLKGKCIFFYVANSTTQIGQSFWVTYWTLIALFSWNNIDEKSQDILLYRNRRFDPKTNQNILMCSLKLIKDLHILENSLLMVYISRCASSF